MVNVMILKELGHHEGLAGNQSKQFKVITRKCDECADFAKASRSRRNGREGQHCGVAQVLRLATTWQSTWSMGFPTKRDCVIPIDLGSQDAGNEGAVRFGKSAAPNFLGWVPRETDPFRVLAGTSESSARSYLLRTRRGRRLAAQASLAVACLRTSPNSVAPSNR